MPDTPNDFLSSYFYGLSQATKAKEFSAKQALEKQKLQFQMQEHNDLMAQHAKEYTSGQDYKNAMLKIAQTREEREHANQVRDDLEKFQEKGGFFMPKPTDKPFSYETGGAQTPPAPGVPMGGIMPQAAGGFQPKGPMAPQDIAPSQNFIQSLQGMQTPKIPMQATISAESQMPDPNVARQAPAMEGQPADTIPMRTTPQEQELQNIRAKYSAKHEDDIPTPNFIQDWFAGGKADPNSPPLPKAMSPTDVTKMGELRIRDIEARAKNAESEVFKLKMLGEAQQGRMQLAAFQAMVKNQQDGNIEAKVKTVVDDPVGSGQSFYTLTPKSREAAMTEFTKYGLGTPRKLSSQAINQQDAANQMLSFANKITDQLHDPELQKYFGAVNGRAALLALEKVGDVPNVSPALKEKLARLQGNLNIFKLMETRAALPGGRLLSSVLEQMGNSTARMSTALPIMEGHILGSKDNARAVLEGIEDGVGKGWKDRTTFQDSLHTKLQDIHPVGNVPKAEMDKMPLNTIVSIKGHKFLKKEVFDTSGDIEHGEVSARGPGRIQVFKVD